MEGRSAPRGPQCQLPLFEGDEGDLLGGYQLMMFLSQPQKIPPKTPERDQYGSGGRGERGWLQIWNQISLLKHLLHEEVT